MAFDLPPKGTESGAVCRLLLAENRSPAYASYAASTSMMCMQWMKRVLVNRLANHPGRFNAPGATGLTDIIKASGQFAGFEGYPNYDESIRKNILEMIHIANAKHDKRSATYLAHLKNAVRVADSAPVADPSPTGLYGWRTGGSGSPGSGFAEFKGLGGVTFYTLAALKE